MLFGKRATAAALGSVQERSKKAAKLRGYDTTATATATAWLLNALLFVFEDTRMQRLDWAGLDRHHLVGILERSSFRPRYPEGTVQQARL